MTHLTLAFRVCLTVFLLFALIIPSSLADAVNPFTHPAKDESVRLGTVFNITWTPTKGDTLNIELWEDPNGQGGGARSLGYTCPGLDVKYCGLIAEKIPNHGFYEWSLFGGTGVEGEYWLDMYYSGTGWDGKRPAMANSTTDKFKIVYDLQGPTNNGGQTVIESGSSSLSTATKTSGSTSTASTASSAPKATASSSSGSSNFVSRVEDSALAIVLLGLALLAF